MPYKNVLFPKYTIKPDHSLTPLMYNVHSSDGYNNNKSEVSPIDLPSLTKFHENCEYDLKKLNKVDITTYYKLCSYTHSSPSTKGRSNRRQTLLFQHKNKKSEQRVTKK